MVTPRTIQEVIAEESRRMVEHERNTIAARIDGQDYTIADLRRVFNWVCDPKDWKNPVNALVPELMAPVTMAAIEWFHGTKARSQRWFVSGPGLCLVTGPGYCDRVNQ